MRPLVGIAVFVATVSIGGCSVLFDGKDLHGKAGGGSGGTGGGGTGGTGGGGSGGTGGGGGTAQCTAFSHAVMFNKSTPSVAAMTPEYVAVSDIDADGKLDIVSANYNGNSFSVLIGDGAGSFALAPSSPVSSCTAPWIVVTRDLNNDQLDDVIVSCFSAPTAAVDVYVNESTPGNVKFAAAKPLDVSGIMGVPFIVTGKLAGDANVDLAFANPNDNTLRIYTGDGTGTFALSSPTYPMGMASKWGTAGDLNADGVDDLVVFDDDDADLTMLLSKAGGGFASSKLAHPAAGGTLYFVKNPPSFIDIDHDGLLDILVASGTSTPGTVEKFLNSGTATAPAFPDTPVDIDTGDLPVAQGFGDFNCDGTTDIAVSSVGCDQANAPPNCPGSMSQPPKLWILPGHGAGYDAAQDFDIPAGAYNLQIADLNGDGYPDIVGASDGTTITVLMNAGM